MKKLMLACCFLVGAVSVSFAQGGQGGQGGGGRMRMDPAQMAARYKDALKLTDDQTTKVTAIFAAEATKRDSITKAGGDARTGMQAIRQADQAKIKALLTPEQADAMAKMPPMGRGGRGGQGGGQGGQAGGAQQK